MEVFISATKKKKQQRKQCGFQVNVVDIDLLEPPNSADSIRGKKPKTLHQCQFLTVSKELIWLNTLKEEKLLQQIISLGALKYLNYTQQKTVRKAQLRENLSRYKRTQNQKTHTFQ